MPLTTAGKVIVAVGGSLAVAGIAYLLWRSTQNAAASVPATVPGTVPGTQPSTQPGTVPGTVPAGPLSAVVCYDAPPLECGTGMIVPQYGEFLLEVTGTPGDVVGVLLSSVNASGPPACDFSSATVYATLPAVGSVGIIQTLTVFGYYYYIVTDAAGYCSNPVFVQTQGEPPPEAYSSCGCD